MPAIRPALWALALLGALALTACEAGADNPSDSDPVVGADRIEMHDNAFDPVAVEVPVGTTVTWAFTDDGTEHNVVGDDFESDTAAAGTFTHTFDSPGTYDYTCTLHSGMDGRVIVTDS